MAADDQDLLPGIVLPCTEDDEERRAPARRVPPIGADIIRRDPETARAVVREYLDSGLSLNAIAKMHDLSRDIVTVLVQGALASMTPDDRARALFNRESAIKSKLVETALNLMDDEVQVERLGISGAVELVGKLSQPAPADGPQRLAVGQLQPAADDYIDLAEIELLNGSSGKKKCAAAAPGAPEKTPADSGIRSVRSIAQSCGSAEKREDSSAVAVSVVGLADSSGAPEGAAAAAPAARQGAGGPPPAPASRAENYNVSAPQGVDSTKENTI